MFNPYNNQISIDRINNQIQDLEKIRDGYQNMPQQIPVNIYNNAMPSQNDFKAQILNENDTPDKILVNSRTMFFEPKKGKLYIKEVNGDIEEYDVVIPLTEEQKKIQELERKVEEYEDKVCCFKKYAKQTVDLMVDAYKWKTMSESCSDIDMRNKYMSVSDTLFGLFMTEHNHIGSMFKES